MSETKGITTSLIMSSVQRAFAQKLSKQHAADVRKHMSNTTYPMQKDLSKSGSSVSVSLCDIVDPVDYEEFLQQHQLLVERDPLSQVLDFPENDVNVITIPRRIRTLEPVVPKEPFNKLAPHVQDCIRCYICDWLVVDYQYRRHSSSSWLQDLSDLRQSLVSAIPRQEYAMDHDQSACDNLSGQDEHLDSQSVGARSSWASLNLRNSESDQLIPGLLERVPPETIDQRNEARRMEGIHPPLFLLYPSQDVSELVERRTPAEMPGPPTPHRILVKCTQLKLSLEVEPMFASMALYDVRERRKLSENFYWDMNEEGMKKMLGAHAPHADMSTTSRSCILDVSHPSPDLFLVIRLEKVLQGDLADVCEPYLKDEKNVDRVKASAADACDRLGKYRMPFAWTAVHLASVLGGNTSGNSGSLDRDASLDKDFSASHSLERKSSLSRRGSLERRASSERTGPAAVDLSSFRPLTVTVQSFFKQESDRLRDEDLYKLLLELKRPASLLKKLKCIPGTLKLDICPCLDQPKFSLTPELEKIAPYPSPEGKVRPCKEVMEFPCQETYGPHCAYRNLLFVYPKEVNFASRAGSARNIAVKVQIMCGEEPTDAMSLIFGKSSCLELNTEAYSSVIYHNKCPSFHDEIKMKLPANLGEEHHLLFTFYHVSCQRKVEQATVESAVGYTWAPLFSGGRLLCGELCLPVMAEPPPPNYSYISPQVCLPGTKWVDNHRAIFTLSLEPVSSVHTQDIHLDKLLGLTTMLEAGPIPVRIGEANLEKELRASLSELGQARAENVAKFLPLVAGKLLALMVGPTQVAGQPVNLASDAFHSLCLLAKNVSTLPGRTGDRHERHSLLTSLVAFHRLPTRPPAMPASMPANMPARLAKSSSNPDVNADLEVDVITRGLDRACSMRQQGAGASGGLQMGPSGPGTPKCLHEELALQWVVSTGATRELALTHSWFLLELLAKSMVQEACLDLPREQRFSPHFTDDVATLAAVLTAEITARHHKDTSLSQRMNSSLAFFLFDLFSTMDRGFVFHLIKSYCKQMAVAIAAAADPTILMGLKVDLLRIVCSHEHFVPLNLPFGTPVMRGSAPSSPTPSVCSSTSQSSLASTLVPPDRTSFSELTPAFQRHHFLVGLVLSQLSSSLQCAQTGYSAVQGRVVNLVRHLMTCHDFDPRYAQPECKARVAALYLPLLGIVMDNLSQLCLPLEGLSLGDDGDGDGESGSGFNAVVAMAISGSSIFNKSQGENLAGARLAQGGGRLSAETRRHLLACFVWVLKNVSKPVLTGCWKELPLSRFHRLLETLGLCITCLEYRAASSHRTENAAGSLQAKARLEDVILGQGSARSEMMQRRKNAVASSSSSALDKPRWRKEQTYRSSSALLDSNTGLHSERLERAELGSRLEGNLAAEVSFTILDTLEDIVRVLSQSDHLQGLLGVVLKLLLAALSRRQSSSVLASMFATQRALVFKFPNLLFDEETEQCADLCLQLLKHCSGNLAQVRSQASASLYLLMRQNFEIGNNFARVKMQVTMSLSSLVGTSATFNEQSLRRSLKTILVYAEQDRELQDTSFPEQVKELLFNLHMILSDTVKMKEFKEDPEMLLDLMYRIAKGYQNSPDLRITWLENMAQKHKERKNHTEAGMCLVHSAALVAEYLRMLEPSPALPAGAAHFERVSPNALDESAVSDDVLRPEDDGLCLGKDFTESGLVALLEAAAQSLYLAGMYEATNDVYHILIPIAEANRDYKKLTYIHGKLHEAFLRVEQLQGKRVFGTYFRVGFYGAKFGDLNGEEYIYKEPTLTKLPEIFSRLENFYVERFGPDNIVVIKDSNTVDLSELNPEKAYLQITYVEPYFEPFEARHRATHFDRNFNMKRFVYATPFTPSGRAHGELHEQHKRKTILTTAKHFPYVKTRIQVVHRKQLELSPIQVAIEDIQKKTQELAAATRQEPADPKILQMVLQGCIGTTVNQGPMEIATVFLTELKDRQKTPTKLQNKLRLCFKDFSKKCLDALKKNKNLIGLDQKDYQRELERNYHRFQERLAPLITQPSRR